MSETESGKAKATVLNIAEADWELLPGHHDGAYSKLVFGPETEHGQLIDHRISCDLPKGTVAPHTHTVQEQIYHLLEGEGVMEIDGERRVVRRHDVVFIPRRRARDPQHRPGEPRLPGHHRVAEG